MEDSWYVVLIFITTQTCFIIANGVMCEHPRAQTDVQLGFLILFLIIDVKSRLIEIQLVVSVVLNTGLISDESFDFADRLRT